MDTPNFDDPSFSRATTSSHHLEPRNSYGNLYQGEDRFTEVAQSSGQRVLSKLRTRQMDLSSSLKDSKGQTPKPKNDAQLHLQPPVYIRPPQPMPRKLEPLLPIAKDAAETRQCERRPSVRASRDAIHNWLLNLSTGPRRLKKSPFF